MIRSIIIALLITIPAAAQSSNILILRQHQHLIIVGDGNPVNLGDPLFSWEGEHSRVFFTKDNGYVTIEFKLDVTGPDWRYLTIHDTENGIYLTNYRVSTTGFIVEFDATWYQTYDDLMKDPIYGLAVRSLLERFGQNPRLPEAASLRTIIFGMKPIANPAVMDRCKSLLEQLNDDHWPVREAALAQLSNNDLAPYAIAMAQQVKLTTEQREAVYSIMMQYEISFSDVLIDPLVALVLGNDVVVRIEE